MPSSGCNRFLILNWVVGPDSNQRRWGLELAAHRGKNAKKRALVAVAQKLAVLLHKLWVTGEVYEPLHVRKGSKAVAA
jgi:transposase